MINDIKTYIKTPKGIALAVVAIIILGLSLYLLFVFAVSPAAIRNPKVEHAHIRMNVISDGKDVNFGDNTFQETYVEGVCSEDLTASPIHFHDNMDHFMHLHWKDMSGGLALKYYGWNFVGGLDDALGYRLDGLPNVKRVPIFGNALPAYPEDAKLWIYTGAEDSYEQRSEKDFIQQDLETFFNKKSRINSEEFSLLDRIFPKAYAHTGDHDDASEETDVPREQLERINNVLGDVIIFAQSDEPTDSQIKEKFIQLEPLSESTCGG